MKIKEKKQDQVKEDKNLNKPLNKKEGREDQKVELKESIDLNSYFTEYSVKDGGNGDYTDEDYFAGIVEDINEHNNDLEYFRIVLDREIHPTKAILLVSCEDQEVKIGTDSYQVSDILDDNFLQWYGDSSVIFAEDYDEVLDKIKDEMYRINTNILPDIARQWGFRKTANKKRGFNEALLPNDQVYLEYDDVEVEGDYGERDWETGCGTKSFHDYVSVTLKVDRDDIMDELVDIVSDEPETENLSDEEFDKYLEDNFDELVDKYYDKLLDAFQDRAQEKAYDTYDPEMHEYDPSDDYDPYEDF